MLNTETIQSLIDSGEDYPLKKHKVKNGDVILISREKLQNVYKNRMIP